MGYRCPLIWNVAPSISQSIKSGKYQHNSVLGDFNAVAYHTDRSSLQMHPTDLQHQKFLSQGALSPCEKSFRSHTYTVPSSEAATEDNEIILSRIDDVLVSSAVSQAAATSTLGATDDSDHLPLMTH